MKLENDAWYEVDDAFAREKIGKLVAMVFDPEIILRSGYSQPFSFAGCMFRDALYTQYKSSTKAKFARKKAKSSSTSRRRDSTRSLAESVQSIISADSAGSSASNDSIQSYNSTLAEETFGSQVISVNRAEPATGGNALHDYYSLLSSYLTNGQPQPKNAAVPINHCVMPMKHSSLFVPSAELLDDIPDDLSGIFDDL